MPTPGPRTSAAVVALLLLITAGLLALGLTTGAAIANILAFLPGSLGAWFSYLAYREARSRPTTSVPSGPEPVTGDAPRVRQAAVLLMALAILGMLITAGFLLVGSGHTTTVTPTGCGPLSVTDQPVTLTGSSAVADLPARWVLDARGAPCALGLEVGRSTRSSQGEHVIVHGRTAGAAMISGPTCRVTIRPDDPPSTLPLELDPTARSGATPLFTSAGTIVVTTEGDPTKCNATLFDDTGTKQGSRATPTRPLRINVDGTYWVETEVDGCRMTVTSV